jgi:hypothetical protein
MDRPGGPTPRATDASREIVGFLTVRVARLRRLMGIPLDGFP